MSEEKLPFQFALSSLFRLFCAEGVPQQQLAFVAPFAVAEIAIGFILVVEVSEADKQKHTYRIPHRSGET